MSVHAFAVSFTPDNAKALLAKLYGSERAIREESDSYPFVAAKLNDHWRVIVCKDSIQWIVQKRSGVDKGEPRWRTGAAGTGFFRNKASLLARVKALGIEVDPIGLALLHALPIRI